MIDIPSVEKGNVTEKNIEILNIDIRIPIRENDIKMRVPDTKGRIVDRRKNASREVGVIPNPRMGRQMIENELKKSCKSGN